MNEFLELPNVIPSEDTINRVFLAIDSFKFETFFIDCVNLNIKAFLRASSCCRRGYVEGRKIKRKEITSSYGLRLGKLKQLSFGASRVNEKFNEIIAIPIRLETLCIAENIITIDAMGT